MFKNLEAARKSLTILIYTPLIQGYVEGKPAAAQVVPGLNATGDGAKGDFRTAEIMAAGQAGKWMNPCPYDPAGPGHPSDL
jgi:hypothetical protein